jgi:hypothetical protein
MKYSFLLIFLSFSFNFFGQELDYKFNDTIDLNSDGKSEFISLTKLNDGTYGYRLAINESEIVGDLADPINGFAMIDIDKLDKYKEIAVHTPGPSNDDMFIIYWYNGKKIQVVDTISGWPAFKGNGIVYVGDWDGFWVKTDKYQLNYSIRELVLIEQPAYYVGLKTKVVKEFHIYLEKSLKTEVALLAEGSEIEILLCDNKGIKDYNELYLIKSSTGLTGWIDLKGLIDKAELHFAD